MVVAGLSMLPALGKKIAVDMMIGPKAVLDRLQVLHTSVFLSQKAVLGPEAYTWHASDVLFALWPAVGLLASLKLVRDVGIVLDTLLVLGPVAGTGPAWNKPLALTLNQRAQPAAAAPCLAEGQ